MTKETEQIKEQPQQEQIKKSLVAISVATSLFLSNANATGIPTIDVAAIAQAVTSYKQTLQDYAEQIKMYEQMVTDTLNFEKQMKELGVDMNSVYDILGDVQNMVSDMQSLYNSVSNIPDDIMGNIARVQSACSFMKQKNSFFGIEVGKASSIKSKINRCTTALRNGANVRKMVDKLNQDMNKIADPIERAKYQAQIAEIKNVAEFMKQKDVADKTDKLLAFQDTFTSKDKNNPYSQAKMQEDLKYLAKQLNKANNQKQAQALTNTLLLKMLEMMQHQYELNINYTSTMASINQSNSKTSNDLIEEDYQREVVEYKRNDTLFEPTTKQLPKDALGLPKFVFTDPTK